MSIKKGTTNISNVRLGTNEIAKAYLGNYVVFNRDAPLWFVGGDKGFWVSQDGKNYTKIKTRNNF